MKRFLSVCLCCLLLWGMAIPGYAQEASQVREIYTVDDLLAIAEAPEGSYILMQDLDMTGVTWPSPDFSGIFDGNGYSILNLTLSEFGPSTPESYDGNSIAYETHYVALFGTLIGAEVKNLNLVNVRALVESDVPVFLAGIAGYFQESTVSNCSVTGNLELRAHDRMFGVGGIAGYGGVGLIENCTVDVTLICTDTDAETKDEQFMGGIYATGFLDVKNCTVTIDGYVSEHGYVHNGGIVGMFMQAPHGWKYTGKLSGNKVYGKITFFEDNRDRRAYCRPIAGEILAYSHSEANNKYEFQRDERKEYDVELRPEMCPEPVYDVLEIPATCNTFGYTDYICTSCGYTYKDHYTLYQHTVTQWSTLLEATEEAEGLEEGSCDLCGFTEQRNLPKLEPVPTEPETEPSTQPEPTEPTVPVKKSNPIPWILLAAVAAAAVVVSVFLLAKPKKKKQGKFQK